MDKTKKNHNPYFFGVLFEGETTTILKTYNFFTNCAKEIFK